MTDLQNEELLFWFFSCTNGSCRFLEVRAVTGFAANSFVFSFSCQCSYVPSIHKSSELQKLHNVIKQEIAVRERGLEKACGAK